MNQHSEVLLTGAQIQSKLKSLSHVPDEGQTAEQVGQLLTELETRGLVSGRCKGIASYARIQEALMSV